MEDLLRPMTTRTSSSPARAHSSTTYWMAGLSTTGSISFGVAFVAGRNLVPRPAAGMTALVTRWLMAATLTRLCADRVRCHPPAIAATGLRGVERVVRSTDDRCRRVAVGREDGDTRRERDLQLQTGHGDRPSPDGVADALGGVARALPACLGKDDDELLAAVAAHDVDLADLVTDAVGDLHHDRVADRMAVRVVDLLEQVEVEHQDGQGAVEPAGALDLPGQGRLEEPVVAEAGEAVGDRQALRLLMKQHFVERHRCLSGEGADGLQVGIVERLVIGPVVEVQHTYDALGGPQRNADQLVRHGLGG